MAVFAFHAGEDRPESVILALGNRVQLVVVTAGAVHRHRHGRGHHLRDHVVEVACPGGALQHVALGLDLPDEVPRARGEEAGGDDGLRVGGGEDVAGDLLADEAVVGLVRVERGDDVVAVAPGVRAELVTFETMRVGIVGDIEPVAGPAFAVTRRGQQLVDQLRVGVRRIIPDEGLDAFGGGRQAVQVEAQAADEGAAIGFG